jgi:hypothetical protein
MKGDILNKNELVHSRNISIRCFRMSADAMLLEGSLQDDRFFPSEAHLSDEHRDKATVHHMRIKMIVSLPQLKIISIIPELQVIPNEACQGALDSVKKLIDLKIKHGFTDAVRNLLGNAEGCVHLMNLILSMGSAAVQGAWASLSDRGKSSPGRQSEMDESILINSCWLWREDGPLAANIRKSKYGKSDS